MRSRLIRMLLVLAALVLLNQAPLAARAGLDEYALRVIADDPDNNTPQTVAGRASASDFFNPGLRDAETVKTAALEEPAEKQFDHGAIGLPCAAHRFDRGVFIGLPTGGPWVDAEAVENDSSDNSGIQFNPNGREVTLYFSQEGVVAGWIDFGGSDGGGADFSHPAANIIPAQQVSSGYNSFSFSWPAGFALGAEVWARFRFSSSRQVSAVQNPLGVSDCSGEVQDCLIDLSPVELTGFDAKSVGGSVEVEWRTVSEAGKIGFHVFRADSEDGHYRQISGSLIHGAGASGSVKAYGYADSTVEPGKSYFYKVADVDYKGRPTMHGPVSATATSPVDYILEQNYPNPFNPETRINFKLREAGYVQLSIYNLKGQEVRRLVAAALPGGVQTISWNGKDNSGITLSTGTYIYKLQVNGFEVSRRMEFVK